MRQNESNDKHNQRNDQPTSSTETFQVQCVTQGSTRKLFWRSKKWQSPSLTDNMQALKGKSGVIQKLWGVGWCTPEFFPSVICDLSELGARLSSSFR